MSVSRSTQQNVISAIAAIALAFVFVACGFAVVAGIPQVTSVVAGATCADDISPFTRDELIEAAEVTRDYTVGEHDEAQLYGMMWDINSQAAEDGRNDIEGAPDLASALDDTAEDGLPSVASLKAVFADASEAYVLNEEAVSHLDDVHEVITRLTMPIIGIAMIAAFCLMAGMRMYSRRVVSNALLWGGAIALALFAILGVWALVSFDGLFAVFHSLFFVEGTWTFPYDSLLICMYPTAFWVGMGAIWLATSCVLSILSCGLGLSMNRRIKRQEQQGVGQQELGQAHAPATEDQGA